MPNQAAIRVLVKSRMLTRLVSCLPSMRMMVVQKQVDEEETVAAVFAPERVEAAVSSSATAAPGVYVSGLPGSLVLLRGRDTAGFGHGQEP